SVRAPVDVLRPTGEFRTDRDPRHRRRKHYRDDGATAQLVGRCLLSQYAEPLPLRLLSGLTLVQLAFPCTAVPSGVSGVPSSRYGTESSCHLVRAPCMTGPRRSTLTAHSLVWLPGLGRR